jgi:glutathione synthase/RimK-type ligase-like ATP-grasp enzyme
MILVCGALADPVTKFVCARLGDCGYGYRFVDLAVYPAGFRVNWQWQNGYPTGYVGGKGWQLNLEKLSGVYVRYLGLEERAPPPNVAPEFASALYSERDTELAMLLESLPCPVVNRMAGAMSNRSKPYQALHIRRCGLHTPPTLLTNDPETARRFYEEFGGQIIYKSISDVRSIVRRMNAEHIARLPFLRDGPAQFQAFIPGDDIRVHTIGDRWFATRIRTEAVDYRYAQEEGFPLEMEATTLPPAVATACLRIAREFRLLLAGIDLKETPEGDYYCFEVNPSPAFLFYEQLSGQPISRALAELLQRGLAQPSRQKPPESRSDELI